MSSETTSQQAIQRVRGTNDVLPPADAGLRRLEAELRAGFEAFGYQGIQTPIIEPLELFLRKSGEEIVARMYAFSHWNRRLCLRPELTASVMRACLAADLQGQSLPLRFHYAGPSFRYERPSRARFRQFTQVGIELIGAAGAAADAEVLHLACRGLQAVGISRCRLVVGHLGAVLQLLAQLGMSEHAQGLVLDLMEPIGRGRLDVDEAVSRVVSLLGGAAGGQADGAVSGLPDALAQLPPEQATAIAADILARASLPVEGGSRQARHIIQRLLAKANRPDPTAQVRAAFEFVGELHRLRGGELRTALERRGLSTTPLDEVEGALGLLAAYGPLGDGVDVEVDLSLARGLRYYTGLVFEIYVGSEEGPLQVCGGGRYDDLVRALGGREQVPACGFSYGLERLDLVRPADADAATQPRVLVVAVAEDDHPAAVAVASQLRQVPGLVVEQDVRLRGPKAALRHADRGGINAVVLLGEQERAQGVAVLRDMRARRETRVPLDQLAGAVRAVVL